MEGCYTTIEIYNMIQQEEKEKKDSSDKKEGVE